MIDFTIMEYDFETRKYTTIGICEAPDSKKAKEIFIKSNGWEPRQGIFLLAKPPLCR